MSRHLRRPVPADGHAWSRTRRRARRSRVQVTVERPTAALGATVGSLTSLPFPLPTPDDRREELGYDLATLHRGAPARAKAGNDYEFTAILPDDRLDPHRCAPAEPVLDGRYVARADPLIKQVAGSPARPMRQGVRARQVPARRRPLQRRVATRTSTRAGTTERRSPKGFLLARHIVGNDEQYAAAMAVLANRVGVSAGWWSARSCPATARCGATTSRPGSRSEWRTARGAPCPPISS